MKIVLEKKTVSIETIYGFFLEFCAILSTNNMILPHRQNNMLLTSIALYGQTKKGGLSMYNNKRRHYRVAKNTIFEDPYNGIYITKKEQNKYFMTTIGVILLSFLGAVSIILKKKTQY